MLMAYNVPVLPLFIKALCDRRYDKQFGAQTTFLFRFCISLLVVIAAVIAVPYLDQISFLAFVAVLGVMDNVAFGTASQFFAMFPPRASGLYFIGASCTAAVSMSITFGTGFAIGGGTYPQAVQTYSISAAVVFIGLCTVVILIRSSIGSRFLELKTKLDRGDSALIAVEADSKNTADAPRAAMSNADLLKATQRSHLSLLIVWFLNQLVFALVSYVPSQSDEFGKPYRPFKLYLLYVGMCANFLARRRKSALLRLRRILHAAVRVVKNTPTVMTT